MTWRRLAPFGARRALLVRAEGIGAETEGSEDCKVTYKLNNSAFFILREKFVSELIRACLSPLTVHFPMGGMLGGAGRWEGAEEDDDEDDEFLAGGGEGSLRHLGVCGEDLEGRRPLVEDGGSVLSLAAGEGRVAGSALGG